MSYHSGKLTKNLVRTLGSGRHGDGNGLYLVVDPSGARRWIVRVTVKGQRNREGKPLRTDLASAARILSLLPNLNQLARWINGAVKSGRAGNIDALKVSARLVTIERQLAQIIGQHSERQQ